MRLQFLRTRPLRTAGLTLALVGLALLPLVSTGCARREAEAKEGSGPIEVVTVSPRVMDLTREIDQPGVLKPYFDTAIYTKIPGFAQEPKVDKGDWVKKDQLLVKLYVPEVDQELHVREAKVLRARADQKQFEEAAKAAWASVQAAEADVAAKLASIDRAKAQVERWIGEEARARDLVHRGTYDVQTAEEMLNQLKASKAVEKEAYSIWMAAQAGRDRAKAQYDKSLADVDVAKAMVKVAEEEEKYWRDWLSYAEIRAPFDGVVTERNVNDGDFLQPANSGATSKSAKPLFTIMRTEIMRMTIQVPEIDAGLVNTGDLRGYDLQLLPNLASHDALPSTGKGMIIVGEIKGVLHFRVFADSGKMILDTDETKLADRSWSENQHQLAELRAELKELTPPHEMSRSKKGYVITAVTNLVARTQLGDIATVRFQAKAGEVPIMKGKVTRGSYALDDRSRTLSVEVFLDNRSGKLQPGMYANVNIKAKLYQATALPAEAIMSDILADGDRDYCYMVEDGKLVKYFLQTGARCDEGVQVLRKQRNGTQVWEEFTGKEVVVTEPQKEKDQPPPKEVGPKALLEGQPVVVVKTSSAS